MRAVLYYSNSDVRVEERPVPEIGPGELLIQVEVSGICGSDVMEWYRRSRAPLVLGHEIAGSIAAVGAKVQGLKPGDRVTAAHHVPCNTCRHCLTGHHTMCHTLHTTNFDPGGFAEFLRLTPLHVDRGVFPLPASVSFDDAIFVEPLACIVRAQRMARMRAGATVLVLGSGIAGLLHVKLARALGAGRILATDISPYRLDAARRVGADAAVGGGAEVAPWVRDANDGRLADLVIVSTGARAALGQALTSVEPGGTVLFFAPATPEVTVPSLPFNNVFFRTDLTVTTSYGASPADYAEALELIRSRRVQVRDMITHRLGLSAAARGFTLVAEARESIKVLLDHHQ